MSMRSQSCNMWYRRVTEIVEAEPPPSQPLPTPWKQQVQFGQVAFVRVPFGPEPPKKRKADVLGGSANIHSRIKRIRLISQIKRVKPPTAFGTKTQLQSFTTLSKGSTISTQEPAQFQIGRSGKQPASDR